MQREVTRVKRKMRIKWRHVATSFLVVLALVFFNTVLCALSVTLVYDVLIPIGTLFSYNLLRYMEKVEGGYSGYEGMKELISLTIFRIFAIPTLFMSVPLAFRMAFGRGRRFKEATGAKIGYADGMRMYMREYGAYDLFAAIVVTTVLWWTPIGAFLSPLVLTFLGPVPPVVGWLCTVALTVLTLPLGAFLAQKRWRAQYICEAME